MSLFCCFTEIYFLSDQIREELLAVCSSVVTVREVHYSVLQPNEDPSVHFRQHGLLKRNQSPLLFKKKKGKKDLSTLSSLDVSGDKKHL